MGQYFLVVNTAKKQFLHAHKFGDGLKLLEFGCSAGGTMTGLSVLLADGNNRGGGDLHSENPIIGSWAGDPIVISGDYADEGRFLSKEEIKDWQERFGTTRAGDDQPVMPNLYQVARETYEDISEKVLIALADDRCLRKDLLEMFVSPHGGLFKETVEKCPELKAKITAPVE